MTESVSYIVTPEAFDVPVANLVPNPSFEVDTTGWTVLTRDTVAPAFGTHSASTLIPTSTVADVALSGLIAVRPSSQYVVSYYSINANGTTLHDYGLQWFQSDGTSLISETTFTQGSFGYLARTYEGAGSNNVFPSPSNAAFARVHVSQQSAPFQNTCTVDAFMLTEGSYLYPYFDGDTADTAQFAYDWTRTAHNSASIRTALT